LELVEYIESTVESMPVQATDDHKVMIRSRAVELQTDSSIGLTWDELDARMGPRWT
jgi:hypothetical protein